MSLTNTDDLPEVALELIDRYGASDLTNRAGGLLKDSADIIDGFAIVAKKMGMGDLYGMMRTYIAEDASPEAQKVRKALAVLDAKGIETSEPDLDSILPEQG